MSFHDRLHSVYVTFASDVNTGAMLYLQTNCEHTPHTYMFNGPLSMTTWVSRYQKGKTNLDFTEARDSEWQWHQLGHMQVCTLLQTDASIPPLCFFTGRMPLLPPNQQHQSTEDKCTTFAVNKLAKIILWHGAWHTIMNIVHINGIVGNKLLVNRHKRSQK